ncbi:LysR substrate-binding domain-containing protein [Kiloniella antarctica]|uniref:LysR substrate-binding domain-containing protein n=1 Tax=Kiloniella antarctica TaxID=1550907 RepID=A0ABW5BLJ5_9PROT
MRKLPPLNSLRAFDAVARNGSLAQAAVELCVSSSAVSQQITILEGWMGIKFLQRTSNKTTLTPDGIRFSQQINLVFDKLEQEVSHRKNIPNESEIRLSILPSLASRWLISRLPAFSLHHPGCRVMVEASVNLVDFSRDNFSLSIRSGPQHLKGNNYQGCHSKKLFDEYVSPACSPTYWANNRIDLKNIGNCRLLADDTFDHENTNLNWQIWFNREGLPPSSSLEPSQSFSDSNLTIQAAVNGEGFMLGRSVLISEEIHRGTLIQPFSEKQISDWPYYIVYPSKYHPPRKSLSSFIHWLQDEAKRTSGIVVG